MTSTKSLSSPAGMRRRDDVLLVLLVLVALGARALPGERIIDDAYITFRYARNIVEGRGFVYNPGEHVLGTTTPLYTLVLAGLSWISGSADFPTIAVAANAVAGALSVALLYLLGQRFVGHWAPPATAALLWALAPYSVTFAAGGMETDLVVTLLLAAAYAYVVDASHALAVLSSLSLLARPDTALLLVLLWLGLVARRRRLPLSEAAVAIAVLAPWLIFATIWFGSPVPGSLAAKSAAYRLPPTAALVRLIQHYSTPFFAHELLGRSWQLAGFAVYLLMAAVGSLRLCQRSRHSWPLLAYPWVYLVTFAVANPLLFRWYLSPPLPFYFLVILSGVWSVTGDLTGIRRGRSLWVPEARHNDGEEEATPESLAKQTRVRLALFSVVGVAVLVATLNAWELRPDHGPDRPAPEMAWFKLELLYARAADVILTAQDREGVLCAADIGVLGYVTQMPILDTVGLVSPEARSYYPADPEIYANNYAIPAEVVLDFDPRFVVFLEVAGRKSLLTEPRFKARYRLTNRLPTDIYDSSGMLVYARRQ